MKLYHFYWKDRGGKVRWLLEELEVPYEAQFLDYKSKEHKTPEFTRINPLGQVPVLLDGGRTIVETGAICAYLADQYPAQRLAPPIDSAERMEYLQWMFFVSATLEPAVLAVFKLKELTEDAKRNEVKLIREKLNPLFGFIESGLGTKSFIVGDQFSAADIMIGSTLVWARNTELLTQSDTQLWDYLNRLWERPAYVKARSFGPREL